MLLNPKLATGCVAKRILARGITTGYLNAQTKIDDFLAAVAPFANGNNGDQTRLFFGF